MNHFRHQGRDARKRQRPPGLLRRYTRLILRLGVLCQRFGLHAQASDDLLDNLRLNQGMPHAKHAVDQVEFQLLDPRQFAQRVLDKGLFGRAVHGLDPKAAQASVGTARLAQLNQRRRLGSRATGMAVRLMAMSVVIVVVIMRLMCVVVADRLVHTVHP